MQKDRKVQSFTKSKRPELFKVKDEHKNPCTYLASNFTYLDKNCVSELSFVINCKYRMLKIKPYVTSRESPSTNLLDPLLTWSMKTQAKCYLSKIGLLLARKVSSTIPSLASRREKPFSLANSSFMTMNMRKTSQAPDTN